jgi:hypothetical protein
MYKFEIGQIVRGAEGILFKVEDTAVDAKGNNIYLLRELFYRYNYQYEQDLEEFHGKVVNKTELRPW